MEKLTYVEAINFAVEHINNIDVIEKLQALRESLEKRASYKSNKPSKTQRENEEVKKVILETLADGEARQCKAIAETLGISGQKCSALLKQLVDDGQIEKFFEKKVAFFKVAGE
jgi:predicted Rossmann fold nucleotide-binding protein DprA/Smf involved in DNA uptake